MGTRNAGAVIALALLGTISEGAAPGQWCTDPSCKTKCVITMKVDKKKHNGKERAAGTTWAVGSGVYDVFDADGHVFGALHQVNKHKCTLALPATPIDLTNATNVVHAKVARVTGEDVTITLGAVKGTVTTGHVFLLSDFFKSGKLVVGFTGTVAAGPDAGKSVTGRMTLTAPH